MFTRSNFCSKPNLFMISKEFKRHNIIAARWTAIFFFFLTKRNRKLKAAWFLFGLKQRQHLRLKMVVAMEDTEVIFCNLLSEAYNSSLTHGDYFSLNSTIFRSVEVTTSRIWVFSHVTQSGLTSVSVFCFSLRICMFFSRSSAIR